MARAGRFGQQPHHRLSEQMEFFKQQFFILVGSGSTEEEQIKNQLIAADSLVDALSGDLQRVRAAAGSSSDPVKLSEKFWADMDLFKEAFRIYVK